MTHFFEKPSSFKIVDCKKVAGERARKACYEWNNLVRRRNKLRSEGRITEAEELERPYLELWEFEKQMLGYSRCKRKKKSKRAKKKQK